MGLLDCRSSPLLARLSELLFVETIRHYLATLPPAQTGWLAGDSVAVVADAAGSDPRQRSDRAFKKLVGAAPGRWRTSNRA